MWWAGKRWSGCLGDPRSLIPGRCPWGDVDGPYRAEEGGCVNNRCSRHCRCWTIHCCWGCQRWRWRWGRWCCSCSCGRCCCSFPVTISVVVSRRLFSKDPSTVVVVVLPTDISWAVTEIIHPNPKMISATNDQMTTFCLRVKNTIVSLVGF